MTRQHFKLLAALPLLFILLIVNQWEAALALLAGLLYLAYALSPNKSLGRWATICLISFLVVFLGSMRMYEDERGVKHITTPIGELIYADNRLWLYAGDTFLGYWQFNSDNHPLPPTYTPYPTNTPYPTHTPQGQQSA